MQHSTPITFSVRVAGVFQGDPADAGESMALLDCQASKSNVHGKARNYRLQLRVSFASELTYLRALRVPDQHALRVLDFTLLRKSTSTHTGDVYEPLAGTGARDHDTKIVRKDKSRSSVLVELVLEVKDDPDRDSIRFTIAIWFKINPDLRSLRMTIDAKFELLNKIQRVISSTFGVRGVRDKVTLQLKGKTSPTPLSWAAGNGWEEYLHRVLQGEGANLNEEDKDGRTPLSWAAGNGQMGTMQLLLHKPRIENNKGDYEGRTPVSWAVGNGQTNIVELLLGKYQIEIIQTDSGGRTLLSWAAGNGQADTLKFLLIGGKIDINGEDAHGRTPLSWAAGNGQADTLTCLLSEPKIDINGEDAHGRTPLSWAAGNGCETTVEMLLEKREEIKPDQPDKHGQTPLFWAAQNGAIHVVISLLTFGSSSMETMAENHDPPVKVDFDASDEGGETPLSRAAQNKHDYITRVLVEEGLKKHPKLGLESSGDLSWASKYLHKAAEKGWDDLAEQLIQKQVAVDSMKGGDNKDFQTPLNIAAEKGHARLVGILLRAGANRDLSIRGRDNPLLSAVRAGKEDVVRVLLESGADISRENSRQERPIDLAINGNMPNHHTICNY